MAVSVNVSANAIATNVRMGVGFARSYGLDPALGVQGMAQGSNAGIDPGNTLGTQTLPITATGAPQPSGTPAQRGYDKGMHRDGWRILQTDGRSQRAAARSMAPSASIVFRALLYAALLASGL